MRVLGIDPGFATTGFGVVERAGGRMAAVTLGAIRTTPGIPQADRLLELREALLAIVGEHRPDVVAVERVEGRREAHDPRAHRRERQALQGGAPGRRAPPVGARSRTDPGLRRPRGADADRRRGGAVCPASASDA